MNGKIIVEVPHRISGFFEIVDQVNGVKLDNPEMIGSRGAGFNISALGRTEVIVEELANDTEMSCLSGCLLFLGGRGRQLVWGLSRCGKSRRMPEQY